MKTIQVAMAAMLIPLCAIAAGCSDPTDALSDDALTQMQKRDPLQPYDAKPTEYSAQQARLEWLKAPASTTTAANTGTETDSTNTGSAGSAGAD